MCVFLEEGLGVKVECVCLQEGFGVKVVCVQSPGRFWVKVVCVCLQGFGLKLCVFVSRRFWG